MLTGIDHLVIAVEDPDAAVDLLERVAGLEPGGGGRHDALGTLNRLVWLGESYLELIGVFDRALAATSWIGRPTMAALAAGGGLATWACATDDLAGDAARMATGDAAWSGPIDGERRGPEGRVVRWRLAHPAVLGPASPFLIEHDGAGAEWTPEERAERGRFLHPIGGRVRLATLEVAAGLEPATRSFARALGLAVTANGNGSSTLAIGEQQVRFRVPGSGTGSWPAATVVLEVDRVVPERTVDLPGVTVVVRSGVRG
jgi:Glyoxalase-like domain